MANLKVLRVAVAVTVLTGGAVAAESVTSAPVKVAGAGSVFSPIPETVRVKRAAVDTDDVIKAAYVADFALDGDRSKAVWSAAEPIAALKTLRGETYAFKSDIRFLYSKTALYVGAVLYQPMEILTAKWDQHDQAIYNDDGLELIFFNEGAKRDNLYHFAFNALGYHFDSLNGFKSYNVRGIEAKTRRFGDRWELEAKIPYRGFFRERPFAGDSTAARVHRLVMQPERRRGSLPQLKKIGNEQTTRLAAFAFLPPTGAAAAQLAAEAEDYRARRTKEIAADRIAMARKLLAERAGAAILFKDEGHSRYCEALAAVKQMQTAFARYDGGQMGESDLLAMSNGFADYVANHAYLVWRGKLWEYGSPASRPKENEGGIGPIVFDVLGNEREQVCLELTGLLCGPRADIRFVCEGVDSKGQFLSRDAVRIYEEPFVRFEKDAITAPLVAKAGNTVTLTPGVTTRVWVQVDTKGVKPGTYQTRILLKPAYDDRIAVKAIPLEIRVAGVALPETHDWPLKSFFWGPNFYDTDETQVLKMEHAAHVTHGWTKARLYEYGVKNDRVKIRPPKGEKRSFDPHIAATANELFFRTAKELKMRFVFGWGTPKEIEWFRLMDRRLTDMGFTRDDFVFKTALRDEFAKADIPLYADTRAAIAACPEKWKFMATYLSVPPPTGATMDDIEAAHLTDTHNLWTVIHGMLKKEKTGPDVIRRLRAKNCEVWSYKCSLYMQTRDILSYFRLYVWDCYMMGLDGVAMWCYGTPDGDPWDSKDGYDDGILWGGVDKTMVTTKRFEAFREGLEDVACMALLEKIMADAKAPKERRERCRRLLDRRAALIERPSQENVDTWRDEALQTLQPISR